MHIQPLSAGSDDESSDGGEYIPGMEELEDDDEDAYLDVDGFTDADADDFPSESMEFDPGQTRLAADDDFDGDRLTLIWGEGSVMGDT